MERQKRLVIDGEDFYLDLLELLQMHKDGITVAEYWTELPPKAELERQLHEALIEARERLARRGVLLQGPRGE